MKYHSRFENNHGECVSYSSISHKELQSYGACVIVQWPLSGLNWMEWLKQNIISW